jgi:SAM-dependent methyltransferase
MTSSEHYVFPSTDAEAQRLELQGSKLYGGVSFLEPFLSHNLRDVLDVGCGSGFFTRHVGDSLPSASVAGLDIDESRSELERVSGDELFIETTVLAWGKKAVNSPSSSRPCAAPRNQSRRPRSS